MCTPKQEGICHWCGHYLGTLGNRLKGHIDFKAIICREQSETTSTNKGRFCNNSKIDTLISKRLSVWEQSETLWTGKSKHLLNSIVYLQFPVERVSLCSLQIITLKLVYQFYCCYKICPCFIILFICYPIYRLPCFSVTLIALNLVYMSS